MAVGRVLLLVVQAEILQICQAPMIPTVMGKGGMTATATIAQAAMVLQMQQGQALDLRAKVPLATVVKVLLAAGGVEVVATLGIPKARV